MKPTAQNTVNIHYPTTYPPNPTSVPCTIQQPGVAKKWACHDFLNDLANDLGRFAIRLEQLLALLALLLDCVILVKELFEQRLLV